VIVVRYADDIVLGFEHRAEAEQFQGELSARLAKFDLTLHADKTRLLEFGRFAVRNCGRRGQGKPATFDFLGFTHICGQGAQARVIVRRRTMQKRLRAKLQEIKAELRRRLHDPVPQQGRWLRSVLLGHYRYDGVPLNRQALAAFRAQVMRLWTHALRRRSQKRRLTRTRRSRLERTWLPVPHIYHPFPWQRLHVTTEDRSPGRETRTLGAARGVSGNRHPYRDPHPHSERLIRYRRWWDVESTYIPEDGARLFQNLQQPWWVAGGWAIDMFLGKHTRPHVHLDIATLRRDQLAIQQYLCSRGWDLHMVMEPGVMRPWPEGELLDPSRHAVWCRPSLDFHDGEMP